MSTEHNDVSATEAPGSTPEPFAKSAKNSSTNLDVGAYDEEEAISDSVTPQARSGTNVVERALTVLGCFTKNQDVSSLGVTEIASMLGLSLGTTHRLVRILVKFGYLEQNSKTARYMLGRSALFLGHAAERELGFHRAREVIETLSAATGESVNLGIRDGNDAVIVLRAESRFPLRLEQPIGSRLPLHASSMGKAILAFSGLEPEVPRGKLISITSHTISEPSALLTELKETRVRGYSIDDEEGTLGVRCVGAPVRQGSTLLSAIAIQVPSVRMPIERFEELGLLAIAAADQIAQLLPIVRYSR